MAQAFKSSGCLVKAIRGFSLVALSLFLILMVLFEYQHVALTRTRKQYPAPGQLIEVAGHVMHIFCTGSGTPTVLIDAGNSSFSIEWLPIQEKIAKTTRVCTYDRSGYGWSEPGPEPRDGEHVVSELYQLLQNAGESAPFLLVGHSLGGVYVRMFAARYPAETAGLVLVDTAYPLTITSEVEMQVQTSIGFYRLMGLLTRTGVMRVLGPLSGENAMPETARKLPVELQKTYLNLLLDPRQYTTAISEMENLPLSFEQANQLLHESHLGSIPSIVLTAGQTSAPGSTPFAVKAVEVTSERMTSQAELAATSSRGEQRIIRDSGHLVHLDAPGEVVQAVLDLVNCNLSSNSHTE